MKKNLQICLTLFIFFLTGYNLFTQVLDHRWNRLVFENDDAWYATDEAKAIAENVLLYQRDIGGWPKNIQMQKPLSDEEKEELKKKKSSTNDCTTDNSATFTEMTFLSRIYKQIPDKRYKEAFIKGLIYLLDAQYSNGGWPQFYPLEKGYSRHITYNDNSMVNIMTLLDGLIQNKYSIIPDSLLLEKSKIAFDKGIDCILKTQYFQNGVLTAWCAQHDENTLQPAKARSYELPSLSGQESAGIVLLLMSVDNPSDAIKASINNAVSWFEKTKITGSRIERYKNEAGEKEKSIVSDSLAPALWARFMELEDNTPFFCDRDGIKKSSLDQIGHERRISYKWYSDAPQEVLDKYPVWKEKWDNEKKN
ncbi:MAG: pectate lyase [Bacteroidales bacterium]|nr:pectate lyase [Bacteroidales bacterium]